MLKSRIMIVVCWASVLAAEPLTLSEEDLSPEEFALQEMLAQKYDAIYFLPDDARRAHKIMAGLIKHEQESIKAALFRLTDSTITKELIKAHERNVLVQVIVDPGALESGHYSKVAQLVKAGIEVYLYQTTGLLPLSKKQNDYQTIMHHKTFIFANTVGGYAIVSSGTLNPTHAGFNGNEEVVTMRNKESFVEKFNRQFEKMKKRSELLTLTDVPAKIKKESKKKTKTQKLADGMHTVLRRLKRITH